MKILLISMMVLVSTTTAANLTMTDEDFSQAFTYHGSRCACDLPGERLDIAYSENDSLKDEIVTLLESRRFARGYEITIFDCVDTAAITWFVLRYEGYDARIALSIPQNKSRCHAWVLVNDGSGEWVGIDPTGDPRYIGVVYTRYPNWTCEQKNCILLNDPTELKLWFPSIEFTPCEVVPI